MNNIYDQLLRDEGKKSSAYQDSLGFWTIGIGTCIDARKGCGLTDDEIELLCRNRLGLLAAKLEEQWPWFGGLDPARQGVFMNMAYQLGIHGLGEFHTMLACVQAGDYSGASTAMRESIWAKEQAPARAERLAVQMSTCEWQ